MSDIGHEFAKMSAAYEGFGEIPTMNPNKINLKFTSKQAKKMAKILLREAQFGDVVTLKLDVKGAMTMDVTVESIDGSYTYTGDSIYD